MTNVIPYDLTTSEGQLRLEIGDTEVDPRGVKPGGGNFTPAELSYFLTQEGGSVGRAAARACEVLARLYAKEPVAYMMGPENEQMRAHDYYAKEAARLRTIYGRIAPRVTRHQSGPVGMTVYPHDLRP